MVEITPRQRHNYAGIGLTILGEACNWIGTKDKVKNNRKLNDTVTAFGVTASVASMLNFFGTLYNDEEGDEDELFLSHLVTMVVCPIIDIYCLANSIKK